MALGQSPIFPEEVELQLPPQWIGQADFQSTDSNSHSFFSLTELRERKFQLLFGILQGIEREPGQIKQEAAATLDLITTLEASNFAAEINTLHDPAQVYQYIRLEVFGTIAPFIGFLQHEPQKTSLLEKGSKQQILADKIVTQIQFDLLQRFDAAIDPAKLEVHMRQVSDYLMYFIDPETGELIQREKAIAVLAGPPNAGKGTTGDILNLQIAASGTDGAAGRTGNMVKFTVDGKEMTLSRDEIAELDKLYRVSDLSPHQAATYTEAMQAISWYDRYELLMKFYDRPRYIGQQIPNQFLTVLFADVMVEVRRALDAQQRFHEPVVLDGAPRNESQAQALLRFINHEQFGGLFYQMISEETAVIRTIGRAMRDYVSKGHIRQDELIGVDFDEAPLIQELFTFTSAGELTPRSIELLHQIIADAERAGITPENAVQSYVRELISTKGQQAKMIPVNDVKGRKASRYWLYLHWKRGLLNACENIGIRIFEVHCDKLTADEVAEAAKEALFT